MKQKVDQLYEQKDSIGKSEEEEGNRNCEGGGRDKQYRLVDASQESAAVLGEICIEYLLLSTI